MRVRELKLLAFSQNWFFQFEGLRLSLDIQIPTDIQLIIEDVSDKKTQEYSFYIKNYHKKLKELASSNQYPSQSDFITINMGETSHTFTISASFGSSRTIIARNIVFLVSQSDGLLKKLHREFTLISKRCCPSSDLMCANGCPIGKELYPEVFIISAIFMSS
ncbi:hypothetical protein HZS_7387 [Henneguya salminicola]|nr:hypothetical protein HZS_7387 [Henneguya salminicola]